MSTRSSFPRSSLIAGLVVASIGCASPPQASRTPVPSDPPASSVPTTAGPTEGPTKRPTSPRPSATTADEPWIVYQDGRGIRLVRPDGSDDHQLVDGPAGTQFHPDWSHDGLRIAYAVDEPDGTRDIWVVGADGVDPIRVFDCTAPCKWTDSPAWSPDDATLAFEHGYAIAGTPDGPGRSTVEVLDLATGVSRPVFEAAATEYVYSPRWSPDGSAIVLELDRFDSERLDASVVEELTIGMLDLGDDVTRFLPLLPWASGAAYPDWSPDGEHIAFVLRAAFDDWDGPSDIHTVAPDGTGLTQVTTFGAQGGRALQPSFTPDGTSIVFVAENVVFEPRVGFVDRDGSGLRQLDDGVGRTHPRLRPTP